MRAAALIIGIPLVVALVALGQIFGLNGATWIWWRLACFAAAALTSIVTAQLASRHTRFELRPGWIAASLVAVAAIAASAVAMAQHFNDSYSGSLVWPRLLACVAFAGFLVVGVAVLRSAR